MTTSVRVLILEDRPADAELMAHALREGGFEPVWTRVHTEAEYERALDPALDVILADYSLPQFDAPRALARLQARGFDIPFIVVTGTLEEAAVECLKHGATDYLLKDRLTRLGPAVTRAIEERRLREAKRRADVALHESEARYRLIADHINDAIVLLDLGGRVLFANPRAQELTGYTIGEFQGRSLLTLLTPEGARTVQGRLDAVQAGREVPPVFEIELVRKDGRRIWTEVSVTSVPANGTGIARLAVVRDISERKRAEEARTILEAQLRQAQKMEAVGLLAGGIAHDFNNLLTIIMGRSEILRSLVAPDDSARRHVDLIQQTAGRAAAMTQQLLAFSRKQILQPTVLDLNAVVTGMGTLLGRLIGEHIELVTRAAPSIGRVMADQGQLEQVILNLAVNARDAMPRGGTLAIETENVELDEEFVRLHPGASPGSHVRLAVRDTGVGMDAATQARLFEPFFTTKGPGKGTGLGLAMVYGIVKQSEGWIGVDSAPGRGTTFTIHLPRVHVAPDRPETRQAPDRAPRGEETILLVEDEAEVRSLVREVLEGHGYAVLEAEDPRQALSIAERYERPIDLVVTDVVMPDMNGRELVERLVRGRPELRVLYVSGYTEDALGVRGILRPGIALLEKPFTPDALARRVREILDGPRGGSGPGGEGDA